MDWKPLPPTPHGSPLQLRLGKFQPEAHSPSLPAHGTGAGGGRGRGEQDRARRERLQAGSFCLIGSKVEFPPPPSPPNMQMSVVSGGPL